MKKIITAVLCASLLGLSACSATAPTASPASVSPTPSAAVAPTPSPAAQPESTESQIVEKSFPVTVDETIDTLSNYVKDYVQVLPADMKVETTEKESEGSSVAGTSYSYIPYDGVTIPLLDSKETGNVQSVTMIVSLDKLTEENSTDVLLYLGALVGLFEPDTDTLTLVDDELDIVNATSSGKALNLSTGTCAKYMYMVSDGIAMLSIDPI